MIGSSYYRTAEARTAHHTCGFTHKVKLAGQQEQRLRPALSPLNENRGPHEMKISPQIDA